SDESAQVAFSLHSGRRVEPAAADLLVRRYVVQAPHGALDLGAVPLADAQMPAAPQWFADTRLAGELQNPAFAHWYQYSYWTHVLTSRDNTYAIRMADGGAALLRIRSYYCAPEGSGCLTLQYRTVQ